MLDFPARNVIDYQRVQKIIDLRRIWYMTSGDSPGFTQTTWDFNPEKWMSSLVNLVNIHFPMTPTCGLPGLSPLKLSSWIMGFTFFPAAGGWGCWSPVLCFPLVWGDVWILRAFFFVGGCRWFGTPEIHQNSCKKDQCSPLTVRNMNVPCFLPFFNGLFFGGGHD